MRNVAVIGVGDALGIFFQRHLFPGGVPVVISILIILCVIVVTKGPVDLNRSIRV